ncbi:MAG: hypothetical protein GY774_37655 [Planctomycetes bacterium]|nr:hypothetical protein [Planctomycetota bacterium]
MGGGPPLLLLLVDGILDFSFMTFPLSTRLFLATSAFFCFLAADANSAGETPDIIVIILREIIRTSTTAQRENKRFN